MKTKKALALGAAAMVALGVLLVVRLGGEDAPPYTYSELSEADIECDAEDLAVALRGSQSPRDAVEDGFSAGGWSQAHYECIEDKLPELSEKEIDDFSDTMEKVRDYEFERELERESR